MMVKMIKETLVLIPGSACDETVWKPQMDKLSKLCHIRVPELSSCNHLNEMVEESIKNLPRQFLLAGHSLGGCIALEIMRKASHRVKKLCLLSTSAAADDSQMKQNRKNRISIAKTANYPELARTLAEQYTEDKSIVDDVYRMFLRNKKLFIQQQKNIMLRQESESILKNIQQETLIIVGKQDPYFFESTKKIAASIPHAVLEIIEECGHMVTMEKPQITTELMWHWVLGTARGS